MLSQLDSFPTTSPIDPFRKTSGEGKIDVRKKHLSIRRVLLVLSIVAVTHTKAFFRSELSDISAMPPFHILLHARPSF